METLGAAKLLINLRDGILDVQGSEDFVRSIYADFKEQVAKSAIGARAPLATLPPPVAEVADNDERRANSRTRTSRGGSQGDKKRPEYKPTFKSNLDLKELDEWYARFNPTSHNEKILLFAIFLRDQCNIQPCSADDIYTCYRTLKNRTKTPEAFSQAFTTMRARTHFIEYTALDKVSITIAGENHFDEISKRPKEAS